MSLSMYQASVPVLVRALTNLSAILKKAEAHAEARKIDPAVMLGWRLAPDMFNLTRQVQIASDGAKGCAARLAGAEIPSFPDTEATFEELQARIAKTIDFIKGLDKAEIENSADRHIVLKMRSGEIPFNGVSFLTGFALPNFTFHVVTAYAILRSIGVEIGKMDYLGSN